MQAAPLPTAPCRSHHRAPLRKPSSSQKKAIPAPSQTHAGMLPLSALVTVGLGTASCSTLQIRGTGEKWGGGTQTCPSLNPLKEQRVLRA